MTTVPSIRNSSDDLHPMATIPVDSVPSPVARNGSPCAACKYLRRKCLPCCVFAPYFPHNNLQKFIDVDEVYGARNAARLLHSVNLVHRAYLVQSLAYEANIRLADPVYGCLGFISTLQDKLWYLHDELKLVKHYISVCKSAAGRGATMSANGYGDTMNGLPEWSYSMFVNTELMSHAGNYMTELNIDGQNAAWLCS
ncbi:hypothetical protein LUZ63_009025 [Rhynchospora breviuscula]|uniref:LOB domain-containing protein n=1 Tax=Rhynchospora breviuscula TaxID=2022672 RepID=A0A9Q0CE86_9POAL|nr:hypothetical protein LUZ63_009025 [Rhynchospora breviuscula]